MKKETLKILIVEDDLLTRITLKNRLESYGEVYEASTKLEALSIISKLNFDMAFLDLDLDFNLVGLEILKDKFLKNCYTVILSARLDESVIEHAYENGCKDYISKPYTKISIENIFKKFYSIKSNEKTLQKLKDIFITEDIELSKELEIIDQALRSTRPILITGESGTGKTFLAKFIHDLSGNHIPFVHLNCAEISESLLESELFGHEKGAFTGAIKSKKGMLEIADNGILFLDEIATMPLNLQKKLLKAIEEKNFYPLGSEKIVHSNFRLISATCENLNEKIQSGAFRSDFYYRIEGFNVKLKPLRERKNDFNKLIHFFIKKGERLIVFDSKAKIFLNEYKWPGNIRELERTIEVLQTKDRGIVTIADLEILLNKNQIENVKLGNAFHLEEVKRIGMKEYITKIEVDILKAALKINNDKVRQTLSDLKISNNTYYRILENIKNCENLNERK